jgi:hypothetical protein
MSWTLDKTTGVWKCTRYSDLNYAEINNLAEYGEPMSPYEPGFDQNFEPDFDNVIVEMPQLEVMTHGYGHNIKAESFPVVERFLKGKITIPPGTYRFADLVRRKVVVEKDRWIRSNLYGWGGYGITAGDIDPLDAAYIHGTVSFALMRGTRFTVAKSLRRVDAEIGAGDDNWDFDSNTIPRFVNAAVAAIFGPDHYNLTKPIQIRFRGPGKRSIAERRSPGL